MKPISVQLIVKRISSRVDGSLSISAETPELNPEQKLAFFNLQNVVCKTLIQPENSFEAPIEVKTETETKKPSQRLRNVIFIWWKQEGEIGDFDVFYKEKMERLIDSVKQKLD